MFPFSAYAFLSLVLLSTIILCFAAEHSTILSRNLSHIGNIKWWCFEVGLVQKAERAAVDESIFHNPFPLYKCSGRFASEHSSIFITQPLYPSFWKWTDLFYLPSVHQGYQIGFCMCCMVCNHFPHIIVTKIAFSIYVFDVISLYVCTTNFYMISCFSIFLWWIKTRSRFCWHFSIFNWSHLCRKNTLNVNKLLSCHALCQTCYEHKVWH